jgi:3-dehydroquinate synthase
MSYDDFMPHMMRDKKVLSGQLRLVLPTGIGSAEVVSDVPHEQIRLAIEACRK